LCSILGKLRALFGKAVPRRRIVEIDQKLGQIADQATLIIKVPLFESGKGVFCNAFFSLGLEELAFQIGDSRAGVLHNYLSRCACGKKMALTLVLGLSFLKSEIQGLRQRIDRSEFVLGAVQSKDMSVAFL